MKHLVIIGLVIPEPASTAAGTRMMQLIDLFTELGYRISFLTASNNVEFSEKIEIIKIELNDSSFDTLIQQLNPDVVLFDRYIAEEQFGWRVAEYCPNALRLLDTEDLHFLREARRKAFLERKSLETTDYINEIFKREIASIIRCDLSLIISKFEYNLLISHFKLSTDLLFYIPFLSDGMTKELNGFRDRAHFVSIGNFLHEPNWQTVLKLKSIWKLIRKELPSAELHVYGAYASPKVHQLHNEKEGFLVKGRAESVEDVFSKARVLLAPIPFGAGLKGKLWESMIFGLPNVTSSVGAEAMSDDLGWNGFVTDLDDDFVRKAIGLYRDEVEWCKAQQKGIEILSKVYSKQHFTMAFGDRMAMLHVKLSEHRTQNYLGQILSQQQLNATKYMSRWIEEKNKNRS